MISTRLFFSVVLIFLQIDAFCLYKPDTATKVGHDVFMQSMLLVVVWGSIAHIYALIHTDTHTHIHLGRVTVVRRHGSNYARIHNAGIGS